MQIPEISIDVVKSAKRSECAMSNWEEAAIHAAELRYRKFLGLVSKYPDENLSPARDIDEVWHLHMLHPRAYVDDCHRIFGELLDHDGGFGNDTEQQFQDLLSVCANTAKLWEREFGEEYVSDIATQAVRCMKACRKACNKRGRAAA
jgi:hypothetical protein